MLDHLKSVWRFRYFWLSLVQMDLRSRYRRSVLGIGWSLLHPLAMSAVFCLVFSQIMDLSAAKQWADYGYSAPWQGYAAFLIVGMTVWGFFRETISAGCAALIQNEAYIRQAPLPYGIYPLRMVMGMGIHFVIGMVVSAALVVILQGSLDRLGLLWAVLPGMVLMFAFCWGVATLAAFATVFFHDTKHLVEVGTQLMFFLTPIIYGREQLGRAEDLVNLNPVYTFIEIIRKPLVEGVPCDGFIYVQGVVITVATVGLAFGTIGWLQKKVIFEL